VPRKPKTPVGTKPVDGAATSAGNGKTSGPEPRKKLRVPKAATTKKKASAPKKPSARAARTSVEPTDDQIRLRAYFLAERRHKLSLPGDSNHDWIEARRQLIEESQR
jgi:hypothetical protein